MELNKTLEFLEELRKHNTLEWMREQKQIYEEAKTEFICFIQDLTLTIAGFDPSVSGLQAKNLIFRLNRDTRFGRDKSPYHTAFIQGEKLKRVPAGYHPDHPLAEYLKFKSWAVEYPVCDQQLLEHELCSIADTFKKMKPLNDFLNQALEDFILPRRP